MVSVVGDMTKLLADADPRAKQELYNELGLRLEYDPGAEKVLVEVPIPAWGFGRVGGGVRVQDIGN